MGGEEAVDLCLFLPAFEGDASGVAWLAKTMAKARGAAVWRVEVRGEGVGFVAGMLDGTEFVLLAAVGNGGMSLAVLDAVCELASRLGARAVSFDTWRTTLIDAAGKRGWRVASIRMWKAIDGQQKQADESVEPI
jgi:hypothetical protein